MKTTSTLIGITGYATTKDGTKTSKGAGKSYVANIIANKYNLKIISLADPIKRFLYDLFEFSEDQLWGPSELKNKIDERYGISPRELLVKVGTGAIRNIYKDAFIDKLINVSNAIKNGSDYSKIIGVNGTEIYKGVIVEDVRFKNEFNKINSTGVTVRVKRQIEFIPDCNRDMIDEDFKLSEKDLIEIPDDEFDFILNNDETIGEQIGIMMKCLFKE